jgi:ferritin-like metal-binding protein YciE
MAETTTATDAGRELLAKYVGDMAAVETHIEEAIDRQLDMTKDDAKVGPLVREFHDAIRQQKQTMIDLRDSLGSTAGNPIKEFGTDILGKAAGLIDKIRADAISKALRDDYTAFNLAAVSYVMLYTTAKGVGDDKVAETAEQHLSTYAGFIMRINDVIPSVVLSELKDEEGVTVGGGAAGQATSMVDRVWKAAGRANK